MATASSIPKPEIIYQDEPEVLRQAAAEDFSLHIVPPTWRSSKFSLSMAWFGLMSAMFWVVVGSTVALTVGTVNTLIGIALSTVVYGILCNVAARFAARSGTSVALFSRAVFGQVGATFAALLFGVTITYYAIAEGSIVAIALQDYFGGPMSLWYFIVCLYSAPLVMRGVRTWLDRINGILLPLYVFGLIACVIWAISRHGYSSDWLTQLPVGGAELGVPGWWFAFKGRPGAYTWAIMSTLIIGSLIAFRSATTNQIILYLPLFFFFQRLTEPGAALRAALIEGGLMVVMWGAFIVTLAGDWEHIMMHGLLPALLLILYAVGWRRLWQSAQAYEQQSLSLQPRQTV